MVDISGNFPDNKRRILHGSELTKNNPDLIIFALVAAKISDFRNNNGRKCSDQPIGHLNAKCRQLKLIGYHPVIVSSLEFLKKKKCNCHTIRKIILINLFHSLMWLGADNGMGRLRRRFC